MSPGRWHTAQFSKRMGAMCSGQWGGRGGVAWGFRGGEEGEGEGEGEREEEGRSHGDWMSRKIDCQI